MNRSTSRARRNRGAHRRGLYRFPSQRRHCRQHAVSEMALHRARRSSTAMPTRDAMASTSTRRKCRTSMDFPARSTWITSPASDAISSPPGRPFDRGSVDYIAEHAIRLSQSQLHHHRRPGMAGRIDDEDGTPVDSRVNLHGLTPNWSLYFTDTLTLAKNRECDGLRPLQPAHGRQYRPDQSRSPGPARSMATMCFSDSTPPSGLPGARSPR